MTLSLSLLKIKYKVNIAGITNELATYNITNSDNVSQRIKRLHALQGITQRSDPVAPKGFILFTDQVKLTASDFKSYKGLNPGIVEDVNDINPFRILKKMFASAGGPEKSLTDLDKKMASSTCKPICYIIIKPNSSIWCNIGTRNTNPSLSS